MRVFAILVFLASATAVSAADMVNGFALYSNVCLHGESGDLLGTRIALLRLADGVYAMYQESEGWPGEPRMVKLDDGQFKKGRLDFTVQIDRQSRVVQGRVTDKALLLTSGGLRNDEKPLRLDRAPLPEKVHACR